MSLLLEVLSKWAKCKSTPEGVLQLKSKVCDVNKGEMAGMAEEERQPRRNFRARRDVLRDYSDSELLKRFRPIHKQSHSQN